MKFNLPAVAAALLCCLSCVEINTEMGGNLIPLDQTYTIYPKDEALPHGAISVNLTDSLSGFSQSRITIGAIRDSKYGLTTRSSAMTLVPVLDTLDFGNLAAVQVKRFHFSAVFDTVSVSMENQRHIIQNVRVHSLSAPMAPGRDYDTNGSSLQVDYSKSIAAGSPVVYGADSLSFDFTEEYARRFLQLTQQDLGDFSRYVKKIPGIVISTDTPVGEGGRINMYELQLGYDSSVKYVTGNYASLNLLCDYDNDGKAETDTVFNFVYGLTNFTKVDSLFTYSSRGSYPEYCLNLTTHESRPMEGVAGEEYSIEGGGGLKPVISALALKHMAEDMIRSEGGDPRSAVINKASLVLPFRFPDDYRDMFKYPDVLSPTCRIRQNDTTVVFAGLTDASSSDENQGDINRSLLRYEPDITYHLQELLKIHETPEAGESETDVYRRTKLLAGEYDIWMIITANEVVKSSSNSSSELSDYYRMLQYQNYYNSMYYGGYGGYGYGYGGYGYGGYGGYGYDPYSNYYTYAMLAQYANSSTTTTTTTQKLDKDRYYDAVLYGPTNPDASLRPRFLLTFSLAGESK
ncbi:MAG: hypothetical protein IKX67_06620 [Bacteroidales bacterium]|nr:hypothetical protein [Bacteroidales bacterium]